jgi:radical SAM superfamily enzyme YgiQ (UPF0313 family)
MVYYDEPVYRPPSEARSLILQATIGCSHNRCRFCYMYREKRFRTRPWDELRAEIDEASRLRPGTRRIFLADGDALVLSTGKLERILEHIGNVFPRLQRVAAYATPQNLLAKSAGELRRLRERGLSILYYGVETGDPELLRLIEKGATPADMIEGCRRAHEAGMKLSVTVILGLAGRRGSERHATETARLVNIIGPRYLSALTLMLGPHERSYARRMPPDFSFNTPFDSCIELGRLIGLLDVDRCIFRSNHASNYLPLAGTLMKDRDRLLAAIQQALERPDRFLRNEWVRGL